MTSLRAACRPARPFPGATAAAAAAVTTALAAVARAGAGAGAGASSPINAASVDTPTAGRTGGTTGTCAGAAGGGAGAVAHCDRFVSIHGQDQCSGGLRRRARSTRA
jgi:hypothetical protein